MALQKREFRINIFEQLSAFYSKVFDHEFDFSSHHVSLYLFLIHQNNRNNWVEWFKLPFDLAMAGACIGSKTTYYKCLHDLQEWGLIQYQKGANNWKAPKIKVEKLVYNNGQLLIPLSEPLNGNQSVLQLYRSVVLCCTTAVPNLGSLVDTFTSNIVTDNIITLITDNPELFFTKRIKTEFTVTITNSPNFKPSPSPLKNIKFLFEKFSLDVEWLKTVDKEFKISCGKILEWLMKFNEELTKTVDLAKTEVDYAKHFVNWLRKQLNKKSDDKFKDVASQIINRQ